MFVVTSSPIPKGELRLERQTSLHHHNPTTFNRSAALAR
jgi:hypothetical protein